MPKKLKQFLWFVFKSPQRKHSGKGTLFTDIRGWISINRGKKTLRPITVCVGLKNRSATFLKHLVSSLNNCERSQLITLSVFDCNSNDLPNLEEEINTKWEGNAIFQSENIAFSRTKAFNKAISQSQTELLFICDADMQVPHDLVHKINKYVTNRSSWFPISFHLDESGKEGKFKTEGKGIFACTKSHLQQIGMYDESFTEWGDEDWEMFFRFYKNGIRPHRTWEKNLIHHYHPSARPKGYKSKYQ